MCLVGLQATYLNGFPGTFQRRGSRQRVSGDPSNVFGGLSSVFPVVPAKCYTNPLDLFPRMSAINYRDARIQDTLTASTGNYRKGLCNTRSKVQVGPSGEWASHTRFEILKLFSRRYRERVPGNIRRKTANDPFFARQLGRGARNPQEVPIPREGLTQV